MKILTKFAIKENVLVIHKNRINYTQVTEIMTTTTMKGKTQIVYNTLVCSEVPEDQLFSKLEEIEIYDGVRDGRPVPQYRRKKPYTTPGNVKKSDEIENELNDEPDTN